MEVHNGPCSMKSALIQRCIWALHPDEVGWRGKGTLHRLPRENGTFFRQSWSGKWEEWFKRRISRERQIYDITYLWNLKKKNDTIELAYKTETDLQT